MTLSIGFPAKRKPKVVPIKELYALEMFRLHLDPSCECFIRVVSDEGERQSLNTASGQLWKDEQLHNRGLDDAVLMEQTGQWDVRDQPA